MTRKDEEHWLDFKRLRLFLQIAHAGSFSRASTLLGVSQSALSRYIRGLEAATGARVFYRDGRGVQLTEVGKLLQARGNTIMAEVAAARSEIAALNEGAAGTVVLAIQPGVSSLLTVPIAKRAISELGTTRVRLMEGMSGHIFEWLASGQVDLALHYDQPNLARIHTEPVLSQDFLLVGPPEANLTLSRPVPVSRLGQVPLLIPGRPHGLRITLDMLAARKGFTLSIALEVDSATAIMRLIAQGVGYSVLPLALVAEALSARQISATWLTQPRISRTLLMASATHKPFTSETRRLAQIIRQEARKISSQTRAYSSESG